MKIDFIYSEACIHYENCFDSHNLLNSSKGITGTESNLFGNAFELAKRGHEISIYSLWKEYGTYNGINYKNVASDPNHSDIAIAFHDSRPLQRWNTSLKVALHQTYGLISPEEENNQIADVYLSATDMCLDYHKKTRPWGGARWGVVHNSWNLGRYLPWDPVPGRIIFTTSVERGFHRLLEVFPQIKARVPEAHIMVFYMGGSYVNSIKSKNDITLIPHASRNRVLEILSTASVFAYPCDTPTICEVWPMSITEACAAGVPVVLAPDDGIEVIFENGVVLTPGVKKNPGIWQEPFVEKVVEILSHKQSARELSDKGKNWVRPYTFEHASGLLENIFGII